MRKEVKFRGIADCDIPDGNGGGVKQGDMVHGQVVFGDDAPFIVGRVIEHNGDHIISFESWCRIWPETLGEFIGITNKDGVEIFEGDILRHWYTGFKPGVVEWDALHAGYVARFEDNGKTRLVSGAELHNQTVIGNVHQNPDLMRGAK